MAVGLALQNLGADVVLASAVEYRGKVERAGLKFRAVRPGFDDMQRLVGMDRTQLTAALLARGDFLFRKLLMPSLRASYEDMHDIVEGADMVLTSSLGIGARLAAEHRSIPWSTLVLQPMMFLSAFDPPVIPQVEWLTPVLRSLGPGVTGVLLSLVKRAMDGMLRPVRALRKEIGLPPARGDALFDGQFSAWGTIGL
jgi:rhamnosyltransferase subunit B